jgi:hypothetical protein
VDIGAGKGRALFLAAEFGFKRILGIEFARELVDICRQNLRRRFADRMVESPIEIECADALTCPLPVEPIVIYFFNPFNSEMMQKMATQIRDSLRQYPRPIRIVYMNPVCDSELMTGIPGLQRVLFSEILNTYKWNEDS